MSLEQKQIINQFVAEFGFDPFSSSGRQDKLREAAQLAEREAFERALASKPDARFWNTADAMFWAWQARAALAQQDAQAVPPGYKLVPVDHLKQLSEMQDEDWPPQGESGHKLADHWFDAFRRKKDLAKAMINPTNQEPTLETTQPAAHLTPPAVGEYWPGQGGIYVGTLPALDGLPARHMIASAIEAPNRLTWGPHDDVPGATSRTNGQANTAAILAHAASTGQEFPAAAWAHAHTADGHADFHLPSQAELFLASLYAPQVFGKESWYWSSTQVSRLNAFVQYFEGGYSSWGTKDSGFRVRAVRRIPLFPFTTFPLNPFNGAAAPKFFLKEFLESLK